MLDHLGLKAFPGHIGLHRTSLSWSIIPYSLKALRCPAVKKLMLPAKWYHTASISPQGTPVLRSPLGDSDPGRVAALSCSTALWSPGEFLPLVARWLGPDLTPHLQTVSRDRQRHTTQRAACQEFGSLPENLLLASIIEGRYVLVTQSCSTLCDSMDCSPPGSPVHGILQPRILEWVAIPFSRESSQHRDRTWVYLLLWKQILYGLSHHGSPLVQQTWIQTPFGHFIKANSSSNAKNIQEKISHNLQSQ